MPRGARPLGAAVVVIVLGACAGVASPSEGDHIHVGFGLWLCGQYAPALAETRADETGIHSHTDGYIHIHPFSKDASGSRATLGLFLGNVGLAVADERLDATSSEIGQAVERACGSRPEVGLYEWPHGCGQPSPARRVDGDINGHRLPRDGACLALVADEDRYASAGSPPPPLLRRTD